MQLQPLCHSLTASKDHLYFPGGSDGLSSLLAPSSNTIVPLFDGGTFDKQYNVGRQNLSIETPDGTQQALLYAVITGIHLSVNATQCV